MKNTIIITGGAGYIGSKLTDRFISKGLRVVVLDNLSSGKIKNVNKQAVFYEVDITSRDILKIFQKEKPEYIFHLAASKNVNDSINNPVEFAKINVLGSLNVIDSAYKADIKKIVFTSTAAVYGESKKGIAQKEDQALNPSSPYGLTKLATEEYITYMNKFNGMEAIILRFANVYGFGVDSPHKSAVNIFIENLLANKEIVIHGDGTQTRDFVYIDDLIDVFEILTETEFSKIKDIGIFNISTGKEISVIGLANLISKLLKISPNIKYNKSIFVGQKNSLLSTKKAKKVLGWSSKTTLEKGILLTAGFLKKGDNETSK